MGRLTLNPIKHLDPLGSILLSPRWIRLGKPTPVNPYRLRNGVKRGNMLVAAAGPASNFFFAALAALPSKLGWITTIASFNDIGTASLGEISAFLPSVVCIHVLLGVFNLIPIISYGFKVVVERFPGRRCGSSTGLPHGPGHPDGALRCQLHPAAVRCARVDHRRDGLPGIEHHHVIPARNGTGSALNSGAGRTPDS